ncbi:MAG TPA: Hsp20/alpha crystallin family protein [Candidatus Paceibacterota bacterium]|jgi:HSP20 family protein|nr:Hsp20/alpha crystallin family protein [Candidatus Paceibacterota bacterium]
MTADDEQFFETLAGGGAAETGGDKEPRAELARADSSTLASLASRSRTSSRASAKAAHDGEPEGQLTVDVYQTPSDIVVESAIAGVRPDDIDINVTPDSIVIRGAREHEKHVGDEDYLYQECYWGRFARSIILPQEVDPENAEVSFKNGILTVRLPKANKKKSRKLRVKAD